jgi:general L-amino acid transport system permease protein
MRAPRLLTTATTRNIAWQVLVIVLLLAAAFWFARNAAANMAARRIGFGFDFLFRPANIPIGETLINYEPGQPIYMAILVGLLNTVLASVVGISMATILGTAIGIARMSRNLLATSLAGAYVEFVRNVPLLAHLFLAYVALQGLPPLRSAVSLGDVVFLCNRGLFVPALQATHALLPLLLAAATAIGTWLLLVRLARGTKQTFWRPAAFLPWSLGIGLVTFLTALWVAGGSLRVSLPRLQGLNFTGGWTLSPEVTALVVGLAIYYSAFIAEIVRAGILSVPKGQVEAATALGLHARQILRLIVLPQALRVIIPPTTSQYLDLAKTSSLAIAIGYPDLVAVINSVITDTGQAIECVALIMAAFLAINLSISAAMNMLNSRTRIIQR